MVYLFWSVKVNVFAKKHFNRIRRFFQLPHTPLSTIAHSKKIIIVNLAKGKIGSDSANLLGGLLISTIILAGYTRANITESKRVPFFCYLDEFQNVVNMSIIDALSELRKYKLGVILASRPLKRDQSLKK